MANLRPVLATATLVILAASEAGAANINTWIDAGRQRCPSHHLEWISDGDWDDIIGGYMSTLPKAAQSRIDRMADARRQCAGEGAGFECEMSVYTNAISQAGRLKQFVGWGCAHYICTEGAICYTPKPQHGPKPAK